MIISLDQIPEAAKGTSIVLTSGCFDPLHVGHLDLFYAARRLARYLVVLVNSDEWIREWKHHEPFMTQKDRIGIVNALEMITAVALVDGDARGTVADAIREIRPAYFAKGGDIMRRGQIPAAERKACATVGCRIVVGVGGKKIRSSSELKARAS